MENKNEEGDEGRWSLEKGEKGEQGEATRDAIEMDSAGQ